MHSVASNKSQGIEGRMEGESERDKDAIGKTFFIIYVCITVPKTDNNNFKPD